MGVFVHKLEAYIILGRSCAALKLRPVGGVILSSKVDNASVVQVME
jgi:hypothetical protein